MQTLNDYKIIFSLVTIRETSLKPLLYSAIYIKTKRFCIKIIIIIYLILSINAIKSLKVKGKGL